MVKIYSTNRQNWVSVDTDIGQFQVTFSTVHPEIVSIWDSQEGDWVWFESRDLDDTVRLEIIEAATKVFHGE